MQILVTLSFGIICLSLVFTTIASANVSPVNEVIWKVKLKKIDANVEKLVNQIVTEFRPLSDEHKVELNSDMQT